MSRTVKAFLLYRVEIPKRFPIEDAMARIEVLRVPAK